MLQFKGPQDIESLPDSHPAFPLVQDLINRLIINFPEDRPYYPHWVVSDKPLHWPLSIWCLVWIESGPTAGLQDFPLPAYSGPEAVPDEWLLTPALLGS